jgi:2-polyprenyl-3-methyl-5-hydroxy-6-metoxy-1,4-benzoquinol methylase
VLERTMKMEILCYYGAERRDMLAYVPTDAKRILELGCGAGNFGKLIRQRQGAEVWGIELNPAAATLARENLDRVLVGDVVHVIRELSPNAFDCIVANDILEHLVCPDQLLQDVKKCMSPGGIVVASVPHIRHWKALYEIFILGDFRYRDSGTFDRTHLRFFTKKSICRLFKDAGYRVEKIEGNTPSGPMAFVPLTLLNVLFLGRISDWRYARFAVVARLAK